ncbi:hypothetical protein NBO_607g0002 [Nosema bombycis CQ1]|uniref:Uncharacterized protein n=1 Tax=Nosema bombycis (strain CQ1 / CVCC 102059) TaxID=578461 RepID=R0MD48_NOSB1|nr:hypothetical protein NBO_607g0002 [Nosema bombycis CQ1]|eukprot:EOB11980.1 hypothetical protein NBO_607g0002 [Nosema bombycis CQ1]
MKCLIFLLFFLKNIRNEEDSIIVRKVFLLENDFWSEVHDPSNVNKEKNLYKVEILMEDKKNKWIGIKLTADICFYFKHTKMGYVLFKDWMVEKIINHLDLMKVDKSVLKFYFVYTDKPVEDSNHFSRYIGEIETYRTFKLPERCIENSCISFKNDGIAICMFQIKEIFKRLAKINLIKLGRYISIIDPDESEDSMENIEGNTKFDLYYFENYSKCLKSLIKFVKSLRPLTLMEDNTFDSLDLQSFKTRVDFKSALLVSEFYKRLKKKFANELTKYQVKNNKRVNRTLISNFLCKNNNKLAETNSIELFNALFVKCCDYLKYEFLEGKVLFPIEGKYEIEYYIDALCKIFFTSFDSVDESYDINNPGEKKIDFR